MRSTLACLTLALSLIVLAPLGAQDKDKKDKTAPAKPSTKLITLSGCVTRGEAAPEQYTLEDVQEGKYRLSGVKLRDYVGQKVEILGDLVETKRLTIKGGLTPNANVAAQAGAMDPVRAAVESAGGAAGPGIVTLPEFKVKSVRPVTGGCVE